MTFGIVLIDATIYDTIDILYSLFLRMHAHLSGQGLDMMRSKIKDTTMIKRNEIII